MEEWKRICICGLLTTLLFGCSAEAKEVKLHNTDIEVAAEEIIATTKKSLPLKISEKRTDEISHVMIHFISNAALKPEDPYKVDDVYSIFEEYGVSVHYLIDREGEIYSLVPEDRVAYHAGKGSLPDFPNYENKMNQYSIGIELLAIGTKEEMAGIVDEDIYKKIDPTLAGYTDSQYRSLQLLVDNILKRNPSILRNRRHVIGHDEYAPGRKTDPGSLFDWTRIGF
ncbi:N-acetylmuramoyl-L-alanine amidase [Bacillus sp. JJ1521]|uniref:N-acetylmuramoyl-L-alanine amidase n=1 Tax=Bacillus sp. JJ1521 TaxID=3122957 RepID=UPI002FFEDC95